MRGLSEVGQERWWICWNVGEETSVVYMRLYSRECQLEKGWKISRKFLGFLKFSMGQCCFR